MVNIWESCGQYKTQNHSAKNPAYGGHQPSRLFSTLFPFFWKALEQTRQKVLEKQNNVGKVGKAGKVRKVGKEGKEGKVGKAEKVGKVGKVGKEGKVGKVGKVEKVGKVQEIQKVQKSTKVGKLGQVGNGFIWLQVGPSGSSKWLLQMAPPNGSK